MFGVKHEALKELEEKQKQNAQLEVLRKRAKEKEDALKGDAEEHGDARGVVNVNVSSSLSEIISQQQNEIESLKESNKELTDQFSKAKENYNKTLNDLTAKVEELTKKLDELTTLGLIADAKKLEAEQKAKESSHFSFSNIFHPRKP